MLISDLIFQDCLFRMRSGTTRKQALLPRRPEQRDQHRYSRCNSQLMGRKHADIDIRPFGRGGPPVQARLRASRLSRRRDLRSDQSLPGRDEGLHRRLSAVLGRRGQPYDHCVQVGARMPVALPPAAGIRLNRWVPDQKTLASQKRDPTLTRDCVASCRFPGPSVAPKNGRNGV